MVSHYKRVTRSRRNPVGTIIDGNYAEDPVLLATTYSNNAVKIEKNKYETSKAPPELLQFC